MPEAYTKEQLDTVKMAVDYYSKRYGDNKPANGLRAILSALESAERERDKAVALLREVLGWVPESEELFSKAGVYLSSHPLTDDRKASTLSDKEGT